MIFALQLIVQQDYFMLFACENAEGEVMHKYREGSIQNKINMRNLILSDYCLSQVCVAQLLYNSFWCGSTSQKCYMI